MPVRSLPPHTTSRTRLSFAPPKPLMCGQTARHCPGLCVDLGLGHADSVAALWATRGWAGTCSVSTGPGCCFLGEQVAELHRGRGFVARVGSGGLLGASLLPHDGQLCEPLLKDRRARECPVDLGQLGFKASPLCHSSK